MKNVSIKNFWSLNVDEALVASELKDIFKKKDYEVFFPVNAQSEGIDLIFFNKSTKKAVTIQVKGSKPYDPPGYENKEHGKGGKSAQFSVPKTPKEIIDFFIFVASSNNYTFKRKGKTFKKEDYLVIPTDEFKKIREKAFKLSPTGTRLKLFFYTKDKSKKAEVQCQEKKKSGTDPPKYLNNWDLIKKKIKNE